MHQQAPLEVSSPKLNFANCWIESRIVLLESIVLKQKSDVLLLLWSKININNQITGGYGGGFPFGGGGGFGGSYAQADSFSGKKYKFNNFFFETNIFLYSQVDLDLDDDK